MKILSLLIVTLFAFSFVSANAEISDAAKAAIAKVVVTADGGNTDKTDDTVEAVSVACKAFPDAAADIVSAVIIAIGGEDADPEYVGKIVAAALKAAPEFAEAIIAAAVAAAPNAAEQIKTSSTGFVGGNNPLNQNGGGGGGSPSGPPGAS